MGLSEWISIFAIITFVGFAGMFYEVATRVFDDLRLNAPNVCPSPLVGRATWTANYKVAPGMVDGRLAVVEDRPVLAVLCRPAMTTARSGAW